jgi:hypothetical protein
MEIPGDNKLGPSLEERAEKKERKPMKEYMGRRQLLNMILAKAPSTQKWILDRMLKAQKDKEKAMRDISILAKSLGVKIKTLELEQ